MRRKTDPKTGKHTLCEPADMSQETWYVEIANSPQMSS